MLLRLIPYLLIIIPIFSFFYTPEPPLAISSEGRKAIANLTYFLFTIPWWGKILSMFVGILWIANGNKTEETDG